MTSPCFLGTELIPQEGMTDEGVDIANKACFIKARDLGQGGPTPSFSVPTWLEEKAMRIEEDEHQ